MCVCVCVCVCVCATSIIDRTFSILFNNHFDLKIIEKVLSFTPDYFCDDNKKIFHCICKYLNLLSGNRLGGFSYWE